MVPDFQSVRIENTNACGYRCFMCPREKQSRKIGFMSFEDFQIVLSRLPQKSMTMDLHGYGEPLLDKHLIKKINHAKNTGLYKTQIFSTLGVELSDEDIKKLILYGLNILTVSFYGYDRESYKNIHGTDKFELALTNLTRIVHLSEKLGSNILILVKLIDPRLTELNHEQLQRAKEIRQLLSHKKNVFVAYQTAWHNYGGGRTFNPFSNKLCPVVDGQRKNILQITWDLHVIPCCFDYDASIKFGNLRHQTLDEIFTSDAYLSFLDKHRRGDLSNMLVCQGCEKIDLRADK